MQRREKPRTLYSISDMIGVRQHALTEACIQSRAQMESGLRPKMDDILETADEFTAWILSGKSAGNPASGPAKRITWRRKPGDPLPKFKTGSQLINYAMNHGGWKLKDIQRLLKIENPVEIKTEDLATATLKLFPDTAKQAEEAKES